MKPTFTFRKYRKGLVCVVILALCMAAYFERYDILSSAGAWLDVSAPLERPVDSVMVLGGDSTTRPFVAAAIVRAGLANKVILPQLNHSSAVIDGIVPTEEQITRDVLRLGGVDANVIVRIPGPVNSTNDESSRLASYLREHPEERIAIVTSNYHTRRCRLLFARSCGALSQNLRFVGAPTDGFNSRDWWQFESGTVAYVGEYLKIAQAICF